MTPVAFADVDSGDLVCLPQPPYRPMLVTAKGANITIAEYPPRHMGHTKLMSAEAFDAAGYVRYEEES